MEETQAPPRPFARRLAGRARLPRLSGKATAALMVVLLLLPAVFIPAVVRLPMWIRFEIVLGAWWLVWLGMLARLLYAGQRVSDDHALQAPRPWFNWGNREKSDRPEKNEGRKGSWWDGLGWTAPMDIEGCGIVIAIIVGLIVLAAGAWLLIEVAIPLVWFLLYFLVRGMLAAVVNDRHHCRGRLGRSLGWAFVWASAYTAPLALAVWFVHYLAAHRAGV